MQRFHLSGQRFAWALLLLAGVAGSACAQALHTPAAGSAEREAIMNALRVPVQKEAGAPVTFFRVQMKSAKGWAWVVAMAMDKSGKKYLLGKYSSQGILQKVKSGWTVKWWGLSNTNDVVNASRNMYPNAPRSIFFSPPK